MILATGGLAMIGAHTAQARLGLGEERRVARRQPPLETHPEIHARR